MSDEALQMFITAGLGAAAGFAVLMFFRWWDFRDEKRDEGEG